MFVPKFPAKPPPKPIDENPWKNDQSIQHKNFSDRISLYQFLHLTLSWFGQSIYLPQPLDTNQHFDTYWTSVSVLLSVRTWEVSLEYPQIKQANEDHSRIATTKEQESTVRTYRSHRKVETESPSWSRAPLPIISFLFMIIDSRPPFQLSFCDTNTTTL